MDGETLRQWRTERALSLRALAALLDLPANTLWRWERGRLTIERPALLALALRGLDCELSATSAPTPGGPPADASAPLAAPGGQWTWLLLLVRVSGMRAPPCC